MLEEQIKSQRFFIFYNNMHFYKNVFDQHLYNKTYIVNYTARYICFMNTLDASSFPYISCKNINYDAINSLTAKDFLLDNVEYNYCSATMCYILGYTLKKHFGIELKAQKHVREENLLLKYSN